MLLSPQKVFLLLLWPLVSVVEGANILFLIPMSTRSEKQFFEPLINSLASRGHNLTVVTNVGGGSPSPNIRELVPLSVEEVYGGIGDIAQTPSLFWPLIFYDMGAYVGLFDKVYEDPEFQELVLRPLHRHHFHLILTNLYFGAGFYGLAVVGGCPLILLNSYPIANNFLPDLGLYMPPSHIPVPQLPYSDRMTFPQRLFNYLLDWALILQMRFWHIPILESVYRRHLGDSLPSALEIQRNVSLTMMNTHYLTNYHRPLLPDVIEVGGIHCREPGPLPPELQAFLGAEGGFIMISFGTMVNPSTLPEESRLKFIRVLSRLPLRVIWKWEGGMEDAPPNVMLSRWLPQQDLLGHPNIRLFISHGGLLSLQQALYHAVPLLAFPLIFDQFTNGRALEGQGLGIVMNLWDFSEEELQAAIVGLITETKYDTPMMYDEACGTYVEHCRWKERASLLSSVFRGGMNSPLERATYWTEHVLKYGGAPHLHCSARDLSIAQYHSWDVVGVLGVGIAVVGLLFVRGLKCLATAAFPARLTKQKAA